MLYGFYWFVEIILDRDREDNGKSYSDLTQFYSLLTYFYLIGVLEVISTYVKEKIYHNV